MKARILHDLIAVQWPMRRGLQFCNYMSMQCWRRIRILCIHKGRLRSEDYKRIVVGSWFIRTSKQNWMNIFQFMLYWPVKRSIFFIDKKSLGPGRRRQASLINRRTLRSVFESQKNLDLALSFHSLHSNKALERSLRLWFPIVGWVWMVFQWVLFKLLVLWFQ